MLVFSRLVSSRLPDFLCFLVTFFLLLFLKFYDRKQQRTLGLKASSNTGKALLHFTIPILERFFSQNLCQGTFVQRGICRVALGESVLRKQHQNRPLLKKIPQYYISHPLILPRPKAYQTNNPKTGIATPHPHLVPPLLFNDLSPHQAQFWTSQLLPQSLGVFWSQTTYAAWRFIPSTYVST